MRDERCHIRSGCFALAVLALGLAPTTTSCARIDAPAAVPGDGSTIPIGVGGSGGAPDAAADVPTGSSLDGSGPPPPRPDVPTCVGLQCQQGGCPAGMTTSISGTTFAPNGTLPLFNVMVYVPNAPLEPLTPGVSCDRCGKASGRPVASAISNEEGKFKINNAPAGKDIPLVVQVGKWRRKVTLPEVTACQDNVLTDAQLTRLPRNRQEGDLPRIAVTTGGCDSMGCLLPKIGLDPTELAIPSDTKAVGFYKGQMSGIFVPMVIRDGPANMPDAITLWRSEDELSKYDLAMFSCECSEALPSKGPMAWDAVTKYLNKGGRIFGTDFTYVWFKNSTDPALAGAMTIPGGARPGLSPVAIDTTFPKGKALADWMKFVEPMSTHGQIAARTVFDNFSAAMPGAAQVWASSAVRMGAEPHPRILTVNTPVGMPADQQCGRAAHIDAHISMVAGLNAAFPMSCGTQLSAGETAMAFLFFDLAACIQDDTKPVEPPPIVVQ